MKPTTQMYVAFEVAFAAWNEGELSQPNHAKAEALHKLAAAEWGKAYMELRKLDAPKSLITRAEEAVDEHRRAAISHYAKGYVRSAVV